MRYLLALNLRRNVLDDIVASNVDIAVRNNLAGSGITINGVGSSRSDIRAFLPPERGVIAVGVSVLSDTLTPQATRTIDTAVVRAIRDTARRQWSINHIIDGLPRAGDGSSNVDLLPTADVTNIARSVAPGTGVPSTVVEHPTSETRVTDSSNPGVPVGQTTGSSVGIAAGNAGRAAQNWFEEYKTPLYVGAGVIALVSVTLIVRKVL